MRPRSAERLGALLSDWLGMQVEVVEFAGAWLPLPPDQRTRLSAPTAPGTGWRRCGGRRARLGPAGPHHPAHRAARPAGLPAAAAGPARAAPPGVAGPRLCRLRNRLCRQSGAGRARGARRCGWTPQADPPPRLGWNTWMPGPAGGFTARGDAADAVFEAEVIEASASTGASRSRYGRQVETVA